MIGIEAEGAAPVFRKRVIDKPETIASAIRIGNPASWDQAQAAIDESDGLVDVVTDNEIRSAQLWLAREEGVFVEPASAAPIAWLLREPSSTAGSLFADDPIVACTVTGHGLKDPEIISTDLAPAVAATTAAVHAAIGRS